MIVTIILTDKCNRPPPRQPYIKTHEQTRFCAVKGSADQMQLRMYLSVFYLRMHSHHLCVCVLGALGNCAAVATKSTSYMPWWGELWNLLPVVG